MLVGIGEKSLKCFSPKGELLYVASSFDKMKGRLPKDHHFFVGLTGDRTFSRYGVVKKINDPLSVHDLVKLDFKSRNLSIPNLAEVDLQPYERFLEKVNSFPEHTPLATTWIEKGVGILEKKKELRVHKVFFRDLTKEEKMELFGFELNS